jgi:hypothetical protein
MYEQVPGYPLFWPFATGQPSQACTVFKPLMALGKSRLSTQNRLLYYSY